MPQPPQAYGGAAPGLQRPHADSSQRSVRACWDPRDLPEGAVRAPDARPTERCQPDIAEWVELYILAGILGVGTGAIVGAEVGGGDSPMAGLFGTIGVAAGLLSVHALQEAEPLSGMPAAISTGIMIGFVGTAFGLAASGTTGDPELGIRLSWGGALVGTGVGALFAYGFEPTRGQVSFVRSGAIWGSVFGGAGALLLDNPEGDTVGALLLGGMALGTTVTALVAGSASMTQSRALALDAGGVVGGIGGLMIAAMSSGGRGSRGLSPPAVGAGIAVGSAAGLIVGWYLSKPTVAEPAPPTDGLNLRVAAMDNGAWVGARGQF